MLRTIVNTVSKRHSPWTLQKHSKKNIKTTTKTTPPIHEQIEPRRLQNRASKTRLRKNTKNSETMSNKGFPKGDPWGPQGGPTNQGLSPFCSPGRPWDPKCLQDLSQGLPKPPQGPIFNDFGSIFGSKFDKFGSMFRLEVWSEKNGESDALYFILSDHTEFRQSSRDTEPTRQTVTKKWQE